MRAYPAASEDTLCARKLLADWAGEGFVTKEQFERLQQETVSDLRTTNIFLRLVLFFFTLVGVGAAVGLFYEIFLSGASGQTDGVFLLIFAVVCYVGAEVVVARARLYRYGIEEALAVCTITFSYVGIVVFFGGSRSTVDLVLPVVGVALSLWIWHRFGLWYTFPAAMIFAALLPSHWTTSHAAVRVAVALLYGLGLAGVIAARARHRFDYVEDDYSLAEALLWLGIYLALNLQLWSLQMLGRWWGGNGSAASDFARPFYWTTWVLILVLPAVVLVRGVHQKDRFIMAVGGILSVLTLVSNKPYLGWPRKTWDPMLLGILLAGVALLLRRWLARGAGGVRGGFTAARLSGKDRQWMNASSAVFGLVTPQSITPSPQTRTEDFRFGGGASGGGGAGGDF